MKHTSVCMCHIMKKKPIQILYTIIYNFHARTSSSLSLSLSLFFSKNNDIKKLERYITQHKTVSNAKAIQEGKKQ